MTVINRLLKVSLFTIVFFVIVLTSTIEIDAKSISDGNATGSNFNPFDVSSESYRERWNIKGSKDYQYKTGRTLIYDVYSGASSHKYKKKWDVQYSSRYGGGNQPYLVFWGWSAIAGYHHHDRYNQATYILAVNPRTDEEKMYKTEMSSLNATKDFEMGKYSNDPDKVNNLCGSNTYKKSNLDCNMKYEYVGFKAWLPLKELFPNGTTNSEWILYIVKNVEGQVVYEELKVPFHFNELGYNNGKLDLSSGLNANVLKMNGYPVVRRTEPRGTGASHGRYFELNRRYQKKSQNEDEGAAVWYGVSSPHDSGKTRWSSSPFWSFGGDIARISYQINKKSCPDGSIVNVTQSCQVNVTIYHKDKNTGKTLKKESKKATVGKKYTFSAKSKGTFKDNKGNPYVSVPNSKIYSGTTPNNNMSFTFYYKASLPDPTEIVELPNSTPGHVKGHFYWELRRVYQNKPSYVYVESNFYPKGNHVAIDNISHSVKSEGINQQSESPIAFYSNAQDVKNNMLSYNFTYNYTNHYQKNYKCIDKQGSDCFKWQFTSNTPVWSSTYKKTFNLSKYVGKTLQTKVDHNQSDTFVVDHMKDLESLSGKGQNSGSGGKLVVGKRKEHDTTVKKGLTFNKNYYESFGKSSNNAKSINELESQYSFMIEPDKMKYSIELPSDEHKKDSFNPMLQTSNNGHYYPVDVDNSLKSKYRNNTTYAYTSYAFPLLMENITGKNIQDNIAYYVLDFTTDYFFIGEHTGYVQGYSNVNNVIENKMTGAALPTDNEILSSVMNEMELNYKQQTNQELDDNILYVSQSDLEGLHGDKSTLERYYIPIGANSWLEKDKIYNNMIVLQNMGISDVTLIYGQTFSFKNFLLGSISDGATVVEQNDPVLDIDYKTNSKTKTINLKSTKVKEVAEIVSNRPLNYLFGYRMTDRKTISEDIYSIIGSP